MSERPDGWASMADIGRLGIETAASVVERILEMSRGVSEVRLPMLTPTGDGDSARRLRADAERLVDLYADWTRSLLDNALTVASDASSTQKDRLVLGPVAPGQSAESTVWLHVVESTGATACRMHVTTLTGHDGATIPAKAVVCTPDVLDASGEQHSREVHVRVAVPAKTAAGHYHGYLLVNGLSDLALPVRVDVTDP